MNCKWLIHALNCRGDDRYEGLKESSSFTVQYFNCIIFKGIRKYGHPHKEQQQNLRNKLIIKSCAVQNVLQSAATHKK